MRQAGIILAAAAVSTAVALAQQTAPKPGPEIKKLDVMAGAWSVEGDVKPNDMGPGGKMSEDEKCDWEEGDFYLVCHTDFKSANFGNGSALSIFGYSPADKAYIYREFNSWGEEMDSKGSVDGDTWTWTNDEKMGDKTMKGRYTMKFTSSSSYSFTYEMSPDGAKWTTVVDGKASKK